MDTWQVEPQHIPCLMRIRHSSQPSLAKLLTSGKVETLNYSLSSARAATHPESLPRSAGQGSYICPHNQVPKQIAGAMSEEISSCSRLHSKTHTIAFLKAGAQPRARHKKAATMSWQWPSTYNSQQTWQNS